MSSGHPQIAIVDCGSNKVPAIAKLIDDLGGNSSIVSPAQLQSLQSCQPTAIIISGNPMLISASGTGFLSDFEILLDLRLPLLGICFGHQVIGLLHGADVSLGKEDRDLRRVKVLRSTELFDSLPGNCKFQQDHIEEVSLPAQFIHLAASTHCENEAMMHRELPFYGVQFHPETSGIHGRRLLANFLLIAAKEYPC